MLNSFFNTGRSAFGARRIIIFIKCSEKILECIAKDSLIAFYDLILRLATILPR